MRDRAKEEKLSRALQEIARRIDGEIEAIVGERLGWVFVVSVDEQAQYVANVARSDGTLLLSKLLTRWREGAPDVPTHEQPREGA